MKRITTFIIVIVLLTLCKTGYADRENDLTTQINNIRLQIQDLKSQLVQAENGEQRLIGALLEIRRLKEEAVKIAKIEAAKKVEEAEGKK